MSDISFADPVYVDELPPSASRGRTGAGPALAAWLAKVEAGKTAELPSSDADGAHPTSRVTAIRKVAGDDFKIDTRPIVAGKRYRIFATANDAEPATPNGKPAARK
jgi:hypothetical protein